MHLCEQCPSANPCSSPVFAEFVGSGSGDGTGDIFLQTYTVVFNQSATSHIVAIKFFDDMVYENPEFFFIDLSLTANSQNGVNLSPSTAAVTINDDDRESYRVTECCRKC